MSSAYLLNTALCLRASPLSRQSSLKLTRLLRHGLVGAPCGNPPEKVQSRASALDASSSHPTWEKNLRTRFASVDGKKSRRSTPKMTSDPAWKLALVTIEN